MSPDSRDNFNVSDESVVALPYHVDDAIAFMGAPPGPRPLMPYTLPSEFLPADIDPLNLVLIRQSGDAMAPYINDGDHVVVDTRPVLQVRENVPYVIRYGTTAKIKYVSMMSDGSAKLVTLNRQSPDGSPEIITADAIANLRLSLIHI